MWVGLQHATGARARVVGRRLVSLGGACRLLPARVLSKRGQGPHQSPFHRGRGGSRPAASSPSTGQVTVRTRGAFPVKDARVQAGGGHAFGDALAIPGLLAWRPPHRHELIEMSSEADVLVHDRSPAHTVTLLFRFTCTISLSTGWHYHTRNRKGALLAGGDFAWALPAAHPDEEHAHG
jgi:hypothetical protein